MSTTETFKIGDEVYYKGKPWVLIGKKEEIGYSIIKNSQEEKMIDSKHLETKEQYEQRRDNNSYLFHVTW